MGGTSISKILRTSKVAQRVEVLGHFVELNSSLGWVGVSMSAENQQEIKNCLIYIQQFLFDVGAYLCRANKDPFEQFIANTVTNLEQDIDYLNQLLPALNSVILPGGDEHQLAYILLEQFAAEPNTN